MNENRRFRKDLVKASRAAFLGRRAGQELAALFKFLLVKDAPPPPRPFEAGYWEVEFSPLYANRHERRKQAAVGRQVFGRLRKRNQRMLGRGLVRMFKSWPFAPEAA
jgi:hypothetical protein